MRVVLDGGEVIDLGTTETAPTIGIIDYSRRVTDDFGVTTVVERGFSRRMSLRLAVPTDGVDALQRRLADLRATPARWIADDRFDWLSARGFYKDFSIDMPVGPLSFCTLTVEGLAASETFADPGGDPAPDGQPSTLQLLQPIAVTDGVLATSSVPEVDAAEWSAATTYPSGAQVMKAATHRVYESLIAGNVGDDPAAATGKWLDIGPTNRWAMFDQALGTVTAATGQLVVTLTPATAVTGLVVLDTDAGVIRVQAPGYDRTQLRGGVHAETTAVLFLDLNVVAGATVTVTLSASGGATVPRTWNDGATWIDADTWQDGDTAAGTGAVSVGTLLIGQTVDLGLTEASPTAGITDYSRKTVDDFGEVTVIQRAWAKRMTAKALIRSGAVDLVANRIAAVRARPSLWIGQAGLDSLTVYGFFKDFSIEVGENVSKLSLSIEGLSAAAKVKPLQVSVDWPDVGDPTGTKPADNATVGMTDGEAHQSLLTIANGELARIRGRALNFPGADGASVFTIVRRETAERKTDNAAFAETFDLLGAVNQTGTAFVFGDNAVFAQPDGAGATRYVSVSAKLAQQSVAIEDVRQVLVGPDGAYARVLLLADVNGRLVGQTTTNDGTTGSIVFSADEVTIETPDGVKLFYADVDGVKMHHVEVDTIKVDAVGVAEIAQGSVMKPAWRQLDADFTVPNESTLAVFTLPFVKEDNDSALKVQTSLNLKSADDIQCDVSIQVDGMVMAQVQRINLVLVGGQAQISLTPFTYVTGILSGPRSITIKVYNREADNVPLTVCAGSALEVTEMRKAALGSISGSGAALPPASPGTGEAGGTGTGPGGGYDGTVRGSSETRPEV